MSYRKIKGSILVEAYREVKSIGIHRFVERPGKVMPPQTLQQGPLEKLQLVCHAALPVRILHWGLRWVWRPLGHCVWQRWTLKVLVQQGGLAYAFARARVLVHPTTG